MSVEWNGDALVSRVRDGARAGVLEGAQAVATASQELTPVLEGVLRASTFVHMPVEDNGQILTGVGNNMIYAARQHEEVGWNHPRGGQSKYMETAKNQNEDNVRQTVINHIKGNI